MAKEEDERRNGWVWYSSDEFTNLSFSSGVHIAHKQGVLSSVTVSNAQVIAGFDGAVKTCNVESGGTLTVQPVGRAWSVNILNGGYMEVQSDSTVYDINVSHGGVMDCTGSASGVITDYSATCVVRNFAEKVAVIGRLTITSGGLVRGAEVYSGGRAVVQPDAFVDSVTVRSGGTVFIESAGCGRNLDVRPGGRLMLHCGAVVSSLVSNRDVVLDTDSDYIIVEG